MNRLCRFCTIDTKRKSETVSLIVRIMMIICRKTPQKVDGVYYLLPNYAKQATFSNRHLCNLHPANIGIYKINYGDNYGER